MNNMKKAYLLWTTFSLLLAVLTLDAQNSENVSGTKTLLSRYLKASLFLENDQVVINDHTKTKFLELFGNDATVVFDFPVPDESFARNNLKKYENRSRYGSSMISAYNREVSPDKYVASCKTI